MENETKKIEERCDVCGRHKYTRQCGDSHQICEECTKVCLEEDLIVEDSDGLLYTYTEDKVNWRKK